MLLRVAIITLLDDNAVDKQGDVNIGRNRSTVSRAETAVR